MVKISKKLALKIINKMPISKEQKDEVKKGVLQELELIETMDKEALQQRLNEG